MKHAATFVIATTLFSVTLVSACTHTGTQVSRLTASPAPESATQTRSLVTLHFKDQATLDALAQGGVDLFENVDQAKRTVGATLTSTTEGVVKSLGVPYDVVVGTLARSAIPDGYATLAQLNADIKALADRYPKIARQVEIGKSLDGRSILALNITSKPGQGLPAVLIDSGQHSRELPPVELTQRLMHQLVENYGKDAKTTALVDGRDIWIVPVVNPDGRGRVEQGDTMWRKNTRRLSRGAQGVDLNRNCDIHWESGTGSPWAENYKGTAPFSEPESRAMRDLCTKMKFKVSLDIHNYGGMLLWPPGHDKSVTKDESSFQTIGSQIAKPLGYKYGTIAKTIYVTDGDLASWQYAQFGTLAFAAELNDSSFRASLSEAKRDWAAWQRNFIYLIDVAGNPKAAGPEAAVPMPSPKI